MPALIAVQFTLILALSYPLAAVNVWFRDTQYFLKVILQLMFFMTPVFYEAKTIPERFHSITLSPVIPRRAASAGARSETGKPHAQA